MGEREGGREDGGLRTQDARNMVHVIKFHLHQT